MRIITRYEPAHKREFDWYAVDNDTYDGAEDSRNRNHIGWGATEQEAIDDLKRLQQELAECGRNL